MKRFTLWSLAAALIVALGAAVFVLWLKPRTVLEERARRRETLREIAAQSFTRAKTDSGYTLVTGLRCAPLDPDTNGVVEFCLEKKTKRSDGLIYGFERYIFDPRDSGACAVRPMTEHRWPCR